MSLAHKFFIAACIFLLSVPAVSLAATTSSSTDIPSLIAQLQAEVAQLEAQIKAQIGTSTVTISPASVTFTIPASEYTDILNDNLRITYQGAERAQSPVAATDPFRNPLGVFLLDHSQCATTFCSSPNYPTMKTELWPGESTNYLNLRITFDGFGTSSAMVSVTNTQE